MSQASISNAEGEYVGDRSAASTCALGSNRVESPHGVDAADSCPQTISWHGGESPLLSPSGVRARLSSFGFS
jgi:hypothetical protein